jgi:hypothetical protein
VVRNGGAFASHFLSLSAAEHQDRLGDVSLYKV